MEQRVEMNNPRERDDEMEVPKWLMLDILPELRSILCTEWDAQKFLACFDKYQRHVEDEAAIGTNLMRLSKTLQGSLYLFRDLDVSFRMTASYLNRITKLLQLYLDVELRASVMGITYYMEIANRILLQMDFHLKDQDPIYILNVFLMSQRAQNRSHISIMDVLYKKYITVPSWTSPEIELPDKLMLMYITVYKQWISLFFEDKTKVLDIMKHFAKFKPQESFLTNTCIPRSLRVSYLNTKMVKELLTTTDKVDTLKKSLENFVGDDDLDEFPAPTPRGIVMPSLASTVESHLTPHSNENRECVPVPLASNRMQHFVIKEELPRILGEIDLTNENVSQMEWLQEFVRKARDAREVHTFPTSDGGDVICLSDSDECDDGGNVAIDQVPADEVLAKNREKLDSITSNFDLGLNMKEKGGAGVSGSAIKFGIRDDLVGTTARKVPENLGENRAICATDVNTLNVDDSQNSVDNYPIFNEIRMEEAQPNYFCDDFLHRARHTSEHQENVIFSTAPLMKRQLASDDQSVTNGRIVFSTNTSKPSTENYSTIAQEIIADFSDDDDEIESPSMEAFEKADLVEFMDHITEKTTPKTPDYIKPILDKTSSSERSGKVKKKVKFGIAHVLKIDDMSPGITVRDYEGTSPRKTILKSSLKRSLHSSFTRDCEKYTKRLDWMKSQSNILEKRTYLPTDATIPCNAVSPERKTTTTEDVSLSPPQQVKQNQSLIRREFDRKKVKRRNSIACIPYSEKKSNEPPTQLPNDKKLFEAYVPLVKITPIVQENVQENLQDNVTKNVPETKESQVKEVVVKQATPVVILTRSKRSKSTEISFEDISNADSSLRRQKKRIHKQSMETKTQESIESVSKHIPEDLVVSREKVPSRLDEAPIKKQKKYNDVKGKKVENRKEENKNGKLNVLPVGVPEAQSTPIKITSEQLVVVEKKKRGRKPKINKGIVSNIGAQKSGEISKLTQNPCKLTKRTMRMFENDCKLDAARVQVRRFTIQEIGYTINYLEKYPNCNIELLLKSDEFFQQGTRKDVDAVNASTDGNREVGATEGHTKNSDDMKVEQVSDQDAAKRGRRTEGKRNKTPRRLKRSQMYHKILEESGVMEQMEVKPLSMLSMSEEIGKMASPDSTSFHGEASKNMDFRGKPPSPEYANSSISSTVNAEISSTTPLAGPSTTTVEMEKKDPDDARGKSSQKGKKDEVKTANKVEFNGPILRSTRSIPPTLPPKVVQEESTEVVSAGEKEVVSCDSQGDIGDKDVAEDNQIEEKCDKVEEEKVPDEPQVDEKDVEEEMPMEVIVEKSSESPPRCDSQQIVEDRIETVPEDCEDASQEAQKGSTQEESEEDAEQMEETKDDDESSIDFEDFDTVSEYSSAPSENEADPKADTPPPGNSGELDKSIDAAMMNFDASEAFKETSDGECDAPEIKDNLFENISSIESTEQNYLVDNCTLLTGNQSDASKNPSPDSSNVQNVEHMNAPDVPRLMDEQRTYVEHDGLFSSPIYDAEPDEGNKFNGHVADQLMYAHNHANNMLLEADSSENIPRNLAIDDLVEEMPSDDTRLITESDIFEEYCENLTSIGDNVTVETESEIVTEPFGDGAPDDFATVFRASPPSTYLAIPEVLATRKSDRQRIKSHTNLYVEHDYSPRTDTNRITPISTTSRTGDRYLLPPKVEKISRKKSFPGDGRERKKQRRAFDAVQLPAQPRPFVEPQGKVPIESPYLEVHNTLQQQMGRQKCVPLLPAPPFNGDTATMRKFRRPNRTEQTPPLPIYEQISPCAEKIRPIAADVKTTFSMIPSSQAIAALASVAQKNSSDAKKDTTQVFPQTMGEYQILQYPNPTDYIIARQPQGPLPPATFPNSAVGGSQPTTGKVFLATQSEVLPQFVVGESDDLVGDCLGGGSK